MIAIRRDDARKAAVAALLAHHIAASRVSTPPGNADVMDGNGLAHPAMTFWTA